ncbi:MAG: hypothetical protein M1838_000634 [Thelocarpon superellum]|nr:MAG: hypothetical protein M1838_000634 [Thelocarpon superellum]
MAPSSALHTLFSPAELSYLQTSLALDPPIRPDGRAPTQFRPLTAETDILPATNGSARICFADGTEAIVGVKAEVEDSSSPAVAVDGEAAERSGERATPEGDHANPTGQSDWVDLSIEIPGLRDDDALPVFVAAMLNEALVASGSLPRRLYINRRFHWKLHIDILLLSPPLSYPLPLLSLTTHLALLSTRLPRLKSEGEEDPMFDDDWEASVALYPRDGSRNDDSKQPNVTDRPPVTLLVMTVASNIIFDPSKEELAVADGILALSVGKDRLAHHPSSNPRQRRLRLLATRTIDPPSRLTPAGVPNAAIPPAAAPPTPSSAGMGAGVPAGTGTGTSTTAVDDTTAQREKLRQEGKVWTPPRGGLKRALVARIVTQVLRPGGVADEVLDGLEAVDVG